MPSSSERQHHFMEAVSHSPEFAKKVGVPQSVGKDFAAADDKAGITKSHHGKPIKHRKIAEQASPKKGMKAMYKEHK